MRARAGRSPWSLLSRKYRNGGNRQPKHGGEPARERRRGALRRTRRRPRQVIGLGRCGEQEKGIEPLESARCPGAVGRAVQVSVAHALLMKILDTLFGTRIELFKLSELNRVRRTRFRARWLETAFHAVVAERAFVCLAILEAQI